MNIPDELVELAAQRRLIPFLGAGFSAGLGLPTWEEMLSQVAAEIDPGTDFADLLESTNHDYLQVAEYLFLKHDRQIGPIRHVIEKSFSRAPQNPVLSSAHVELVNLAAPQVYTTNYDDLIEQTYRALGVPHSKVILPKDVALADSERTQIVKYHGDLAHERTLVLTESAYYKRLDFESPMDLKFRSDLLGKSVLFMGYSFRDINIRIIWFKLMEMMRDIPEADRRPSYIVRLSRNRALEELYEAVGLKTIVLDEFAAGNDGLGQFLHELSSLANPVGARTQFVSAYSLGRMEDVATRLESRVGMQRVSFPIFGRGAGPLIQTAKSATVPPELELRWRTALIKMLYHVPVDPSVISALLRIGPDPRLTPWIVSVLARVGSDEARASKARLLADDTMWSIVWHGTIDFKDAVLVLRRLAGEIIYQATDETDDDLAYLVDLALRLRDGLVPVLGDADAIASFARRLVDVATSLYPEVSEIPGANSEKPKLDNLIAAIVARGEDFEPSEEAAEAAENIRAELKQLTQKVGVAKGEGMGA